PTAGLDKLYDSDEDGIPDTVDFDDVEEVDYDKDEVIKNKKIALSSRNYLKRLSAFESPDTFVVELTAGTEYTIEFSRGDHYQYPIGEYVPRVEIINPQGDELSFDVDPESETLDDDTAELSVYPYDDPYMICLTFRPTVSGNHTIRLSQMGEGEHIYEDVTLSVYKELRNEETGEAGYRVRYKFYDKDGNESATVSMRDVMALRKTWNDAEKTVIETWETSGDVETKHEIKKISRVQAYLDTLSSLKQLYGIFDDYKEQDKYKEINSYTSSESESESESYEDDPEVTTSAGNPKGTKIPAELYGILYEDKYDLGMGFTAITGAQAQNRAVKKSSITKNITVPKTRSGVTDLFKTSFVSSQEDAEKTSTTTVDASVQLGGFGFSAGHSSSSSFKFGLTSTTYVIHYEQTEKRYRMLEDDEDYALNTNAKSMLEDSSISAFRNEFGDYFVGGYQYGGTYDAIITISTKTTEQLEKVKTHLSASFNSESATASADVGNKSKNYLKTNDATVTIEIRTAGINDDGGYEVTKTTDISTIANSFTQFKNKLSKTSPADFQPVYVMLKRYRLLPDVFKKMKAEGDSGLIPIPSEHSTKVMNFKRDMVTMHAYYNVLNDTNYITMDQEVKNALGRRYDNIKNTVAAQNDTIFEERNAAQLQKLHADMLQLNKDLKIVGDRYVFYRLLMAAQDQEKKSNDSTNVLSKPYGSNGGSIGYTSFMASPAVNADISAGKEDKKEINQFTGSEWTPEFDAGSGHVFCYINVTANNVNDRERRANYPCIGNQKANFYFRCGASRWLEWKIEVKSMVFTQDRYPFTGLKQ
ncbi:MAG: hypothetical protein IJT58_00190, partial [Synergistaceae bacterium]|nr:hypothetical protein [Synergistaceae bacterium]